MKTSPLPRGRPTRRSPKRPSEKGARRDDPLLRRPSPPPPSSGPSSRGPRSGPFLPGSPPRPRQPSARWHQGARYPSQASRRPLSVRSQSAGAAPCGRAASPPSAPFYARGGGEQSALALPAARVPPRLPEVRCASRWADPPPLLLQPGTRQPERGARRLASASPNGTTPRRPPAANQQLWDASKPGRGGLPASALRCERLRSSIFYVLGETVMVYRRSVALMFIKQTRIRM